MADDPERCSLMTPVSGRASEDGELVMLTLAGDTGETVNFGLTANGLEKMIALMLAVAGTCAERTRWQEAATEPGQTVQTMAIAVSGLELLHGRSPAEVLLAVRIGRLRLSFALDQQDIANLCSNLGGLIEGWPEQSVRH